MLGRTQPIFGIVVCFLPILGFGETNASISSFNIPMTEMSELLKTTLPLIYDTEKFTDPANKDLMEEKLEEMVEVFKKIEGHLSNKSITYKVSAKVLSDQLEHAHTSFKRGDSWLAQYILKGIPSVCMSCHIQDREEKKLFHSTNLALPAFAQGEFSFITRDYDQAIQHYEQFLHQANGDAISKRKALERILVIYADIYQKPEIIYQRLQKYQTLNLPSEIKNTLDEWLKGLQEYMTQSGIYEDGIDYQELDQYMKQHYTQIESQWVPNLMEEKDKIFYVMLRSSLHTYLNKDPKANEIPILLYWLAICDRTLEYNFYFSLSDWYLKECMKSHANHPYAQKCYKAYEDYVAFSYTGSRGTDLPIDVQKELFQLQKMLDQS